MVGRCAALYHQLSGSGRVAGGWRPRAAWMPVPMESRQARRTEGPVGPDAGRPAVRQGTARRTPLAALAAAVCAVALLPAASGQSGSDSANQVVGDVVCSACHQEVTRSFRSNPHRAAGRAPAEPVSDRACESCHGPGFLHATSGDTTLIVRFPGLAPLEAQLRCLECHSQDAEMVHVRRSAHFNSQVGCISCHSIHDPHGGGPLLGAEQRQVCYACHGEIRVRFEMPFRHRVNEGVMECSDCHNPHGSPVATWRTAHSPRMVSAAFGNDQPCTGCHADKRGPFVFEHAPVRVEGCQSCHDPHGSTNARMLRQPSVFVMCLECHSDVVGFGTRGEGIPGPSAYFHDLSDPAFRECVLCHSRIHGSNADRWLRR